MANDFDFNEEESDLPRSTTSKITHAVKGAAKRIGKAIMQTVKHMAKILIHVIGPVGAGFLALLLVCGLLYFWLYEMRGTSEDYALQDNDNLLVEGSDIDTAQALSKSQALINAYYNYLSTTSVRKVFVNPDDGTPVWVDFSNTSQTSDYAELTTTDGFEDRFYLSSYFLMMADEVAHQGVFYYPEQFVKPVFSRLLPAEGATDGKVYITTLPLMDNGTPVAKKLYNNLYNGSSEPLYAAGKPYTNTFESLSDDVYEKATLAYLASSHPYEAVSGTANPVQFSAPKEDATVPGAWDYGLGSIVQYESWSKDKFLRAPFVSFDVHVHEYDEETEEFVCNGTVKTITVAADDTAATLQAKIDALNTDTQSVAISPSSDQLTKMAEAGQNPVQCILPDYEMYYAKMSFSNATLNQYFGNDTTHYPIKHAYVSAAATYSGSLRYDYTIQETEAALSDEEMDFYTGYDRTASKLKIGGSADCGFTGDLIAERSGVVVTRTPVLKGTVGEGTSAYADPLGMTYIEPYLSNYTAYVPDNVATSRDFTNRVNAPQEGSYSAELDANSDGTLTVMDFITNLGLMKKYTGELADGESGEYYEINTFKVNEAIKNIRDITAPRTENSGSLWHKLTDGFWEKLKNMLHGVFSSLSNTFGQDYEAPTCYLEYEFYPAVNDVYSVVLQSRTFTYQTMYSDEGDAFDPQLLNFVQFDANRMPGSRGSGMDIVEVAASQIGNEGGQPYWSWYGFDYRVAWCACFVSWCADQCGYIDAGIIPKFAAVSDGIRFYQERDLWQDNTYVPSPGDLIFFDWELDGSPNHVGIVEKVENGYVHTIEGNSSDSCRANKYTLSNPKIIGYGTPLYS